MLCETCRFDSDEGHCGRGLVLIGDECTGYQYGTKAEPPPTIPGWIVFLMNTEKVLLDGIPFLMRGMWEDQCSWDKPNGYSIVRPGKYTFLLLPGQIGYDILARSIRNHIYKIEWGPCRLSIDTQYTTVHQRTHGHGPIVICMSLHHMDKHPEYEQVDMGSYVWWLNPDVPAPHVELFLEGLMVVHNQYYWFIENGKYYKPLPSIEAAPNLHAEPSVYMEQVVMQSPTGVYTRVPPRNTGYTYHEATHRRLVDDYMRGTRDFPNLPLTVVREYYNYWRCLVDTFTANLL